jgi:hypothetical protein
MNFIGIDPSLISTAVVINGEIINYCKESKATNKKGLSKWFKSADPFCSYSFIEYRDFENYSEGEITKLKDYDSITDQIIDDILSKINRIEETWVGIEGYNFGAQVGDLIDLVTFSTLLRKKLFDKVTENIEVLSPTSLKLESCKFSYKPTIKEIGKRKKRIVEEFKNNLGIPGGKFTKREMCLAIIDNEDVCDDWSKYIKSIKKEIMEGKNIPKPHEDINDAWFLYHILKKKHS